MKKILCVFLVLVLLLAGCETNMTDVSGVTLTKYNGTAYYIAETPYDGDYHVEQLKLPFDSEDGHTLNRFGTAGIMTLKEYTDFCAEWGVNPYYTKPGSYAVYGSGQSPAAEVYGVDVCSGAVTVYALETWPSDDENNAYLLAIPVPSDSEYLEFRHCVDRDYYDWLTSPEVMAPEKPILYLYPTEDTALTVTLGHPENVTCSYPAYSDGWQVLAHPDGTLEDLSTGRSLYALYWEGKNYPCSGKRDGFVVAGADSAAFLEEKLAQLGLNEREAEEFIVYWLPRLQASEYNFIRFVSQAELDRYMPLSFTVQPDTVIRVLMEYAPLDAPIRAEPQQLVTPVRSGFTVVEWGGMQCPTPEA